MAVIAFGFQRDRRRRRRVLHGCDVAGADLGGGTRIHNVHADQARRSHTSASSRPTPSEQTPRVAAGGQRERVHRLSSRGGTGRQARAAARPACSCWKPLRPASSTPPTSRAVAESSRRMSSVLPHVAFLCLAPVIGAAEANRFIDGKLTRDHSAGVAGLRVDDPRLRAGQLRARTRPKRRGRESAPDRQ